MATDKLKRVDSLEDLMQEAGDRVLGVDEVEEALRMQNGVTQL